MKKDYFGMKIFISLCHIKKYIAMIEKKVKPEKNKGHQQKACEGFGFLAQFSKKIS